MQMESIRLVALCGSAGTPSSTEGVLRLAAAHAEALGAQVSFYSGEQLRLPIYSPRGSGLTGAAMDYLSSVASSDGVLLASPSYHGSMSGLLKNAVDYLEELRSAERPYLDGRAVGCIAVGAGTQGPGNTLRALRDVVHALRGWPTPLGVTVDGSGVLAGELPPATVQRIGLVARQVVEFAAAHRAAPLATTVPGSS